MIIQTELMNKVFSDTEGELKTAVADKIEEAKLNGEARLDEHGENLKFSTDKDGNVVIDDENNKETTIAKDIDGEVELSPVIETKTQSATQPDVTAERVPGVDGKEIKDTLDDVTVEVDDAVTDKEKSGTDKHYSITLQGFASKESRDEYLNQLYSQQELENMDENVMFSDTELQEFSDEVNTMFSVIDEVCEESETLTFSDLDEMEDYLDRVFSDLSELDSLGYDVEDYADRAQAYSDVLSDLRVRQLAFSVSEYVNEVLDMVRAFSEDPTVEEAPEVYETVNEAAENLENVEGVDTEEAKDALKEFSDAIEYWYEGQMMFSDDDGETLSNNVNELEKAVDVMEETKDPELAKKVKVLSEEAADAAEVAQEAGVEGAEEVKEMCQEFSEKADEVLKENGVDPETVDAEEVKETLEDTPEPVTDETKSHSLYGGQSKLFSSTGASDSFNSCLTSQIN